MDSILDNNSEDLKQTNMNVVAKSTFLFLELWPVISVPNYCISIVSTYTVL